MGAGTSSPGTSLACLLPGGHSPPQRPSRHLGCLPHLQRRALGQRKLPLAFGEPAAPDAGQRGCRAEGTQGRGPRSRATCLLAPSLLRGVNVPACLCGPGVGVTLPTPLPAPSSSPGPCSRPDMSCPCLHPCVWQAQPPGNVQFGRVRPQQPVGLRTGHLSPFVTSVSALLLPLFKSKQQSAPRPGGHTSWACTLAQRR